MELNSIGKRITFLREHFGLKRKDFIAITDSSQAAISRLENDKAEPSENFLNALTVHFLVDPDWVKTGKGEMLFTPEKYMAKGIKIMGPQRFSEGLLNLLKDPQFAEFQSYITLDSLEKESINSDLKEVLQLVSKLWRQGDERSREMLAQVVKSFSAVGEKSREKDK